MQDLWLAKKAIELVCSPTGAQAAQDYTTALHTRIRHIVSPGQSAKRDCRHAFMEAARDELGSGRTRLRR